MITDYVPQQQTIAVIDKPLLLQVNVYDRYGVRVWQRVFSSNEMINLPITGIFIDPRIEILTYH